MTDHSSAAGSVKLAKRIEDYWTARGGSVKVTTFPMGRHKASGWLTGIRSNLRNGLPIKWIVPELAVSYVIEQTKALKEEPCPSP